MFIRRAFPDETNYLLKLMAQAVNESTMGYQENNEQKTFENFVPLLRSGAYYLISADRNMLTGWVLIGKEFNSFSNAKAGAIFSLFVYPQYRKLGIGKELMLAAIEELKNHGFEKVQLNVFAGNPARLLYEELGFKEVSRIMEMDLL